MNVYVVTVDACDDYETPERIGIVGSPERGRELCDTRARESQSESYEVSPPQWKGNQGTSKVRYKYNGLWHTTYEHYEIEEVEVLS